MYGTVRSHLGEIALSATESRALMHWPLDVGGKDRPAWHRPEGRGPWYTDHYNKKSHAQFRLVAKSTTWDDLERQLYKLNK